jgi:hypothetical protein
MVDTIKFSEFLSGGDLDNDSVTVGLGSGGNRRFNNPWTFLPPGTTAERPAPDPSMHYRLRFNTDEPTTYEFYDPNPGEWVQIEDSTDINNLIDRLAAHTNGDGASMIGLENQGIVTDKTVQDLANAEIIARVNNGTLQNAQFLSNLLTGFLVNTTGTGVLTTQELTGEPNQIIVANGTGAGVPTFSLSPTLILPGTMQAGGDVDMDGNLISNVLDPVSAQDAATKAYVDAVAGGGLIGWTNVTGTTQSIFPGNGYVTNNGSLVVLTLPATAAFGTVISIVGLGAGGWRIDQNAGQNIQVGSLSSTTGTSGSVASTNQFDSINLVCTVANTRWATHGGVQGALTIV